MTSSDCRNATWVCVHEGRATLLRRGSTNCNATRVRVHPKGYDKRAARCTASRGAG